ncbi:hypothetical protein ACFL0C_01395 [Patescibacteria group bacterium]
MKKYNLKFKLIIFVTLLLFTLVAKNSRNIFPSFLNNYADAESREEEDEEDEEDDEDEHDDDYKEEIIEYYEEVPIEDEVLVLAPRVTYVWVYDAGYDVDTDKDLLVDALDPHPSIKESLLFTDTDDDSIPDALDQYPGVCDFMFQEDTDNNNNGILDSYEQ